MLCETDVAITHHLGNRPYLFDVLRRDPTPQAAIFTSMPAFALAESMAVAFPDDERDLLVHGNVARIYNL